VKIQSFIKWPFAVFLLFFGAPSDDPTVLTAADIVLSSLLVGLVWGLILGLPLALIFRKRDQPPTRGSFLVMGAAFVATLALDLLGLGLIGAGAYILWLLRPSSKPKAPWKAQR
jgi:hypothetical protein